MELIFAYIDDPPSENIHQFADFAASSTNGRVDLQ